MNSDSSLAGYVILLEDARNSLKLNNADTLNPYIDLKKGLPIYTIGCRCDKYASGSKFLGKCMVRICIDNHVLNIIDSLDNQQIP